MFARSGPTPKSHVSMTKLCKFYLRLLHPKEIAEKADEHFFFYWRLQLIFENVNFGRIRQKTAVLVFWCLLRGIFFSKKYFLLYGRF
jgi:hypothetical protein